MKISIFKKNIVNIDSQAIVLPVFENEKLFGQVAKIDEKMDGFLTTIIKDGYFTPSLGQVHAVYTHNKISAKKIILLGMGKKKDIDEDGLYRAYSSATSYVSKIKIDECTIYLGEQKLKVMQNIVETTLLSLYRFHHHKSKKDRLYLSKINYVIDGKCNQQEIDNIKNVSMSIVEGIYKARDLSNHPSNHMTPKALSREAKMIATGHNISVKIFGEKELDKMGMKLFTSVSKGSDEDAQLAILDYKPKKYQKTIALVGKGLTFDTGGLSLKPTSPIDAMIGMNMDMSGAAAVIGIFEAIKQIKPKNVRVIGAVAAAENMISGKAQKPGDIWKSYNGKTVEVLNTDAEGRLVLADTISFIQKNYEVDYLVDLATLTGACVVALGHEFTGLFSNNQNFANKFIGNSQMSYEKVWQMPITRAYHEEMKGELADLKNIGNGRDAGSCTAAAFLEEFIDLKMAWVHLDIAGTAMLSKPLRSYEFKGGTGVGVKTIIDLIINL
jgi:leucyl aminopeptidase